MGPLQVAGIAAVIGIVSAYAAMLVVGIPLHLVLRRRRWTSLLPYPLSAFAAGVALRCVAIVASWLPFARGGGSSSYCWPDFLFRLWFMILRNDEICAVF